jgi:hypothetical protein
VNLPNTAAALREELQIGASFDEATSKKYEGLLEKKWTSVVRLQKKVGFLQRISAFSLNACHLDNGSGVAKLRSPIRT